MNINSLVSLGACLVFSSINLSTNLSTQAQVEIAQSITNNDTEISLLVKNLRVAIIGQESNYKYSAVNPHSGALGFAQVMPFNIGPWSRQALGYEINPQRFLNSPKLQLKIIDYKIGEYLADALEVSKGNIDIAVMRVSAQWYSGNPNLYTSTKPQFYRGHRYPSINKYCQSVLKRFRAQVASH